MKEIFLTKNKIAIVDDDCFDELSQYKWHATGIDKYTYYASRAVKLPDGSYTDVKMHRLILGLTSNDKCQVDHINHNGLDNRKSNLRKVSVSQNQFNSKIRCDNSSGIKGIRCIDGKNWQARVRHNGKEIHIGCFKSRDMANKAYIKKVTELCGKEWNNG